MNFPESLSQQILVGIILVGRLGVPLLDGQAGKAGRAGRAGRGRQRQAGARRAQTFYTSHT